jgi:hypothetical protein
MMEVRGVELSCSAREPRRSKILTLSVRITSRSLTVLAILLVAVAERYSPPVRASWPLRVQGQYTPQDPSPYTGVGQSQGRTVY